MGIGYLDRSYIRVLSNIFELIQAFFRHLSLAKVDTELDEPEHNGF
jgi:hypothetical protein